METTERLTMRKARPADIPVMTALIHQSVRGLSRGFYSDQQIENEASQAIERLVTALPGAIRTSIVGVQPAQRWADQVINHLLKTLRMLVMVARVEEANDARDRAY